MKKEHSELERREIVMTVDEGKGSPYWKILKKRIEAWINEEASYVESFKQTGIKDHEVKSYNGALIRIEYLKKLLNINETILNENLKFFEQLKRTEEFNKLYERIIGASNSFVGLFSE